MEPIVVKKGDKKVTIVGKVIGIFRKLWHQLLIAECGLRIEIEE